MLVKGATAVLGLHLQMHCISNVILCIVRWIYWIYEEVNWLIEAEWPIYARLGRHQAIIWTNAGMLLTGPLETNISQIVFEIQTFSLKKMHLKMSPGKYRPFCLGFSVLNCIFFGATMALWQDTLSTTLPFCGESACDRWIDKGPETRRFECCCS